MGKVGDPGGKGCVVFCITEELPRGLAEEVEIAGGVNDSRGGGNVDFPHGGMIGGGDRKRVGGKAEKGEDHVSGIGRIGVAKAGEDVQKGRGKGAVVCLLVFLEGGSDAALVREDLNVCETVDEFVLESVSVAEGLMKGVREAMSLDISLYVEKCVYPFPGHRRTPASNQHYARCKRHFLHDPDLLPYLRLEENCRECLGPPFRRSSFGDLLFDLFRWNKIISMPTIILPITEMFSSSVMLPSLSMTAAPSSSIDASLPSQSRSTEQR